MEQPPNVEGLRPGIEGRQERVVDETLLTRHLGGRGVLSTPGMISLLEMTCHDSVAASLPEGFTTVGYEVHVRHLRRTEPGATVIVMSRLRELRGTKLLFEVECHEGNQLVGQGTHKRAVVPARS